MLVLASASPRRRDLLTQAGFAFEVLTASVNEDVRPGERPIGYVLRLAREKAERVAASPAFQTLAQRSAEPPILLGADTTVVAPNGEILGKPESDADAARMLRLLAGATHQVITGVAMLVPQADIAEVAAEVTHVTMLTPSDEDIAALHRHRRTPRQSRRLRHPGPRRSLDPPHPRLLFQCRWVAAGARRPP